MKKEEEPIMRHAVLILTVLTALSVTAGISGADEDEYGESGEHSSAEFYGTIDALPQVGRDGIWMVNGRQVVVNRGTEIKEKRGRITVGSYVKVEGYPSGSSFTADEIEVKGRRH
jgi:hypothetical protein